MSLNPLFVTDETLGPCTDLYELTMAAAYFQSGVTHHRATFELFTRRLPPNRNFLLAAGLEQALHYLTHVGFSGDVIDYLRGLDVFRRVEPGFFEYLREFRFTGDVWALPEGTPFFGYEPVLQIEAPVIEAQVVETYLISTLNLQTMVASKAARLCLAAGDRPVVDFGSRRAHGPQAGVLAARAAYIGGCAGTSNVLAGHTAGIPLFGTMAHSFVQFFDDEAVAFRAFHEAFPENTVLLVDTYDTLQGVQKVIDLGTRVRGIRLDSGDLAELAREARRRLDDAGLERVEIMASGSLTEKHLQSFASRNVPMTGYGVGTDLVVSLDAPTCDMVYKLVEVKGDSGEARPRFKSSPDKVTYPHRKQIHRRTDGEEMRDDLLARSDEDPTPEGGVYQPLIRPYLREGRLCGPVPALAEIRRSAREALRRLPAECRSLRETWEYPVRVSAALERAIDSLRTRHNQDRSP
jgi:nicotinate phosphoribosyltransferase